MRIEDRVIFNLHVRGVYENYGISEIGRPYNKISFHTYTCEHMAM